nr:type IV pilin N-terminal domain-containing protein [Natrarchaeobius halalkaliphilus]
MDGAASPSPPDARSRTTSRALSPVVGVVALVAITVCLAAIVAVGAASLSLGSTAPTAAFDLSVDGDENEIVIEHVAGESLDVRELSIVVAVDDTRLSEQPPVPFVGANGFEGTPSGPFNERSDPTWHSGEHASLTVARNNDPSPNSGDSVSVSLSVDGHRLATLETVAE